MAIYHNYFLFDPDHVAKEVFIYNTILRSEGFEEFRARVISLFDTSNQIRVLADQYGSWDRKSLIELPVPSSYTPQDVSFYITLVIYASLRKVSGTSISGLGTKISVATEILAQFGWNNEESNITIRGRNFKEYFDDWLKPSLNEQESDVWDYIRPASTASQMGWLSAIDVKTIYQKLSEIKIDQMVISSQNVATSLEVWNEISHVFSASQSEDSGLCIIISG